MNQSKGDFTQSLQNSIGDLYKEFYSSHELELLAGELFQAYQNKNEEQIHIQHYTPAENDPLLRINLTCITVVCLSMPFFTSRIREYFYSHGTEINRSIHFHPDANHEMYYIEVRNAENKRLPKLIEELNTSFHKIIKYTEDYRKFTGEEGAEWLQDWAKDEQELLDWLIDKGSIWEGAYYQNLETQNTKSFGYIEESGKEWNWFQSLTTDSKNCTFLARNTNLPAFLADGELMYLAFFNQKRKLLLKASLSQNAQNAGLQDIPIYKNYLDKFFALEEIQPYSGLGRTVRMIFNYIPREILLVTPQKAYHTIYSALMEQSLKSSIRSTGIHIEEDLYLIISFVPEEKWSEEKWLEVSKIIQELCPDAFYKSYNVFRGKIIEGFQIIRSEEMNKQKLFELSSRIEFNFRSWNDHFHMKWEDRFNEEPIPNIEFRSDYTATHSPESAINDISRVRKLGEEQLIVEVHQHSGENTILLAITKDKEFHLSDWVRALNHFGLSPISQRVYRFFYDQARYAKTEFFFENIPNEKDFYQRLKKAFRYAMQGILPSDPLCEALTKTSLGVDGLFFLKAIRDYCMQTNPAFHKADLNEALLKYPKFCEEAWNYFCQKFQHGSPISEDTLKALSDKAATLKDDEILNAFRTAILAILRTNFFGLGSKEIHQEKTGISGIDRKTVAFKIDSSIPISLPEPRPYREIFVYSADFQGIHLRGGAVARGGLRFSDRTTDYRTEILSLMKTQMVKNALIVPVGSKGGFVLSKNSYNSQGLPMVEAYKRYINSLIALTDNREKGKVIHYAEAAGPYAYDAEDPYLVVAADKGTAQLSDTANSLSEQQNFWLGDAFASGGSRGYSHKELGITAKGALVTADRQFRALNIDFRQEPITVVAIGDMGGDVFGNGMLDSQYFKLVAAFNHKHIFLDPNPDPQISYQERKRLFFAEKSGWDHYNTEKISTGGGVYDRTEKAIQISPEVQKALAIQVSSLSGIELIRCMLQAPVDMLYNGGIGTYVKSVEEDNAKVGDPSNNELRINAKEVQAKVISEGGNLGLTQKGRIEFSQNGGEIFTDALDNSGGVDLSDHEVNLKLFFSYLKEKEIITSDTKRDELMQEVANNVVDKVLRNNALQSLTINTDHYESLQIGWKGYQEASHFLIGKKILNPITEFLPATNHEWSAWKEKSDAIPKPAICILMGYVKMELYSASLERKIFHAEKYPEIYLDYFPEKLVSLYREELFQHPLNQEIITTQLINFYINLMGITGTLVLGKQNDAERIVYLKEVVEEFAKNNLYQLLNEVSVIRKKEKEAEIIDFISKIRENLRKKFTLSNAKEGIVSHSLVEELSVAAREHLKGIS